jgi:hypothetical protein
LETNSPNQGARPTSREQAQEPRLPGRAVLRHTLELPDRTVTDVYFPAPLQAGDRITVEGERFLVERAVTLHDALREQVVHARLRTFTAGDPPTA